MAAISEFSPNFNFTEERKLGKVRKGFTHFAEGDVLFAKITPCMENGKGAIARGLKNRLGCGSTELHVLRPKDILTADYLFRFLSQDKIREDAKNNFTGTAGQSRVPTNFMRNLVIALPPIPEQSEIVRRIGALFEMADQIESRYKKAQAHVDKLTQSWLKPSMANLFHNVFE